MRGQRVHRDFFRMKVREATGLDQYARRHSALSVGLQGTEAAHIAHPEYVDDMVELQDEFGGFVYLIDYSVVDGEDIIL